MKKRSFSICVFLISITFCFVSCDLLNPTDTPEDLALPQLINSIPADGCSNWQDTDTTCIIHFDKKIVCDSVKALLVYNETDTLSLQVASRIGLSDSLVLTNYGKFPSGSVRILVSNLYSEQLKLVKDTLEIQFVVLETRIPYSTTVYEENFSSNADNTVPLGWQVFFDGIGVSGSPETRTSGTYTLGPRIFSFPMSTVMKKGFYGRSSSTTLGYIQFGSLPGYPFHLVKGYNMLTYDAIGWRTAPNYVTCRILDSTNVEVCSRKLLINNHINSSKANTLSQRVSDTLYFETTYTGNYKLKWTFDQEGTINSTNMYEGIIGNIKVRY